MSALWVEDPDLSSGSSGAYLLCLLLLLLLLCDSLWVDLCWSLSWESSLSLDLQYILKWFLFPHWWQYLPHAGHSLGRWDCTTSAACLTWATLGSMAITFLEFEGLNLINGCCCSNSTIGLVLVDVFYCHLVLLGMLEEGLICDMSSLFIFNLTHFFTSKCFVAWKSNSVLVYHFLIFSFVLGSFYQYLWCIDLTGQ